jgi:hypothetical protein
MLIAHQLAAESELAIVRYTKWASQAELELTLYKSLYIT